MHNQIKNAHKCCPSKATIIVKEVYLTVEVVALVCDKCGEEINRKQDI
ncbi:hypothetical protein [Tenacibaculum maritimum]|nr:hypothetical protein [Tenacibaculum maritimum]MCD9582308.1 hypothetical protein [Tenacibaculum maritimum]MCD9636690.1 hypothetical protein [Tenacibaculum maritimum]